MLATQSFQFHCVARRPPGTTPAVFF